MYEFTMGGAWFRWSALDTKSKRLAAWSLGLSFVGAVALGSFAAEFGYQIGLCMGSGDWARCHGMDIAMHPGLVVLMLAAAFGSAITWAMLSKRQDEMFNRVQNWALGSAGAWTGAICIVWSLLALGDIVPMLPLWVAALLYVHLLFLFWFVAVRRWA